MPMSAPAGASIDPDSGAISWLATDGDSGGSSVDFGVRVSDADGETAERSFTVNVLNVAPTLSAMDALRNAAEQLALPTSATRVVGSTSANELVLSAERLSHDPIPAHLIHEAMPDGRILLAWDLTILSLIHI